MMVGERQRLERFDIRLHIVNHLLRACYTRQQQDIGVLLLRNPRLIAAEEQIWSPIVQRSEEQRLISIELHSLCQHTIVDRIEGIGTFRDDNNVGAFFAFYRLTQPSRRQQLIVNDKAVIVDKQNVYPRFDIPVLISVIEDYHISVLRLLIVD